MLTWRAAAATPLRAATAFLAASLALLACSLTDRARGGTLEEEVKATYLYKLAAFVEWPQGAGARGSFNLCVVGDNPFGGLLKQAVQGQTINGRPIVVQRFRTIAGNPGCQIMYVTGSAAQPPSAILAAVHGAPVLTVTDEARDRADTGIINFVLVDNHVRFEINDAEATEDGLIISSKLLSLAVRVQSGAKE